MIALIVHAIAPIAMAEQSKEKPQISQTEIFAIYDQVNGFDIETAALGAVKGQDTQVRELAVMVLRDHSAVRQWARDIAAAEGAEYKVDAKSEGAVGHNEAMAKLKSLSGTEFDQAYLAHERVFHTNAIAAIRTALLPASTSETFKAHLEAVLPGFEHHLAETIRVEKELGYAKN
ncbi:TPA: DUF4142 domain-containing protein [Klebsiella pneumoniae]|uniref:DUF4142 domain-containing protein n=1 Tax=Burkholderia cepacia TaxID=292 RepID=UPI001F1FC697|nr:DUF4142 domain-containing protein [Burkholderia cepacia]MCE4131628.1 DUF4142 domain-containing protein [Burkholderia cepacia]HCQ8620619.1 DUF4142 domain-containing protein [Klebsiella pneumoniae]HCQ8693177.1 DUF4142 domain-containing protein [Klebsiella pneumoniae]